MSRQVRRFWRQGVALGICNAVVAIALSAFAGPKAECSSADQAEANRLFDHGKQRTRDGDASEAMAAYASALARCPSARAAANLGDLELGAKRFADALAHLTLARELTTDADGRLRALIDERLELARAHVDAPVEPAPNPLAASSAPAVPPPIVSAPVAIVTAQPAVAQAGPSPTRVALVVTGASLSAVAVGIGVASAVRFANASQERNRVLMESDFSHGCGAGAGYADACGAAEALGEQRQRAGNTAIVSLSIGAALGIATTLLAAWPRGVPSPARSAVMVGPWIDGRTSGLIAAGGF
jgi:hypothetical protein